MKNLFIIVLIYVCFLSCKSQNSEKKFITKESQISEKEFEDNSENLIHRFILKRKNQKTISLSLNNGEVMLFKNNTGEPYDENRINYTLVKSEKTEKYVINVREYERNYFLLVDKNNKNIDTIPSYPHFSKNKNTIFMIKNNPYETYENILPPSEDIYIYVYIKNQLKKIYSKPYHFFSDTYLDSFFWKKENILYLKFVNEVNKSESKYISLTISYY